MQLFKIGFFQQVRKEVVLDSHLPLVCTRIHEPVYFISYYIPTIILAKTIGKDYKHNYFESQSRFILYHSR